MKQKVFTLGFVKSSIFEFSMKAIYENGLKRLDWDHYFLYQHYPIEHNRNAIRLLETCTKYGIKWVDAGEDLGLHKGWNYLCEAVTTVPGEVVISLDPDAWPITKGWDSNLANAVIEPLAFVCLNNFHNLNTHFPLRVYFLPYNTPGGLTMSPANYPTMIGVTAWSMNWLKSIGGFHQASSHWGHLEQHLWDKLRLTQKCYGILLDSKEGEFPGPEHDVLYRQYKDDQASFSSKTSMKEWLTIRENND